MLDSLIVAVLAFASTNVDDFFILLVLCHHQRFRRVLLGQSLGFAAIVVVSGVVSLGAALLRPSWLGFLGLAPFAIGVRGLLALRRKPGDGQASRVHPVGHLAIAAITLANGADNIAVYAPLFAGRSAARVGAMLLVFAVLVPIWCGLAFRVARWPGVASRLDRWGHWLAPVVLLGLGAYLFVKGGALTLVLAQLFVRS